MTTDKIGVDPGYGGKKAAVVRNGIIETSSFPSVVGIGNMDVGLVGMHLGRGKAQAKPMSVDLGDGMPYLVGPNVHQYGRPSERMDFNRLANGPELRAMFAASFWRILGAGEHQADLLIGLPVEVMADAPLAQRTLKELRGWLVAEHDFTVNGEQVTVTVSRAGVMAQPLGAYFNWALGNDGRPRQSKAAMSRPVGTIDWGFNTLALYGIEGGQPIPALTAGDTLGMRRAAEGLIAAIEQRHARQLTLHEADALIRAKRPILFTPEGDQDVGDLVRQSLDSAASAAISFIERTWGKGRQFSHVLATGGGALAMGEHLLRQYPHVVLSDDPVMDNAKGFAKFALRLK
ncbi:MAG: ParM/StbA family protein [Dehalococcoidales bacterium]